MITPVFSHDGKTLILGDGERDDGPRIVAYDLATGAEHGSSRRAATSSRTSSLRPTAGRWRQGWPGR